MAAAIINNNKCTDTKDTKVEVVSNSADPAIGRIGQERAVHFSTGPSLGGLSQVPLVANSAESALENIEGEYVDVMHSGGFWEGGVIVQVVPGLESKIMHIRWQSISEGTEYCIQLNSNNIDSVIAGYGVWSDTAIKGDDQLKFKQDTYVNVKINNAWERGKIVVAKKCQVLIEFEKKTVDSFCEKRTVPSKWFHIYKDLIRLVQPFVMPQTLDESLFVEKDKKILEDNICSVCTEVPLHPYESDCGRVVCSKCSDNWDRVQKEKQQQLQDDFDDDDNEKNIDQGNCIVCRKPQTVLMHKSNIVTRKLSGCQVKCLNHARGCTFITQLGDNGVHLKTHLEGKCAFEKVQCDKCNEFDGLRHELDDHVKNACEIKCPYCLITFVRKEFHLHLLNNSTEILQCKNQFQCHQCQKLYLANDQHLHTPICLENQKTECVVCKLPVKCKELDAHYNANGAHHIKFLLEMLYQQSFVQPIKTSTPSNKDEKKSINPPAAQERAMHFPTEPALGRLGQKKSSNYPLGSPSPVNRTDHKTQSRRSSLPYISSIPYHNNRYSSSIAATSIAIASGGSLSQPVSPYSAAAVTPKPPTAAIPSHRRHFSFSSSSASAATPIRK